MFKTKNIFYLRISDSHILPLYVYLDERHVHWMSDAILQHVLADLRPSVIPKLKEAAAAALSPQKKQPTVDTHRGDTYQFCFFIRDVDPHSVIIKTRKHVAAPVRPKKRRKIEKKTPSAKKRKTTEQIDVDMELSDDELRADSPSPQPMAPPEIQIEEEEDKPKPLLQLSYQGFPLSVCICVVVEPWPVMRDPSRARSMSLRASSVVPGGSSRLTPAPREQTPLFLPEDDPRATPARGDTLPPVPLFDSSANDWEIQGEEDKEEGGMMAFSQVLAAPERASAIGGDEDDDDPSDSET